MMCLLYLVLWMCVCETSDASPMEPFLGVLQRVG